jgi:hypothetical protein
VEATSGIPALPQGASTEALEALAAATFALDPPMPHERGFVLRAEAAELLDRLLVRVARGRGALDVAVGEALAALADGDRLLALGLASLGDYARERLGMGERTAQAMARLARELRERPLLAAAVRGGEVSARKALVVLPAARGEAEGDWVERARAETVRSLEAAVRAAGLAGGGSEDVEWHRFRASFTPEDYARLDEAMGLAGKHLGAGAPRWQRLEAACQEYLGAHPVAEPGTGEEVPAWPVSDWLAAARQGLEEEYRCWAFLEPVPPVPTPQREEESDPFRLDAELLRLVAMRGRWDELVGHLGMLLGYLGLWRDMKFASLDHYCAERLGMGARTLEQRAWLARRFYALPALRRALREGRLSYEKARLVAGVADDRSVEEWIRKAEEKTCIALRREIVAREEAEERQMCAWRKLDLRMPRSVVLVVGAAIRAARKAEGRWLTPEACLVRVAEHFIATWKPLLRGRRPRWAKVLERDQGFCQVPGCSRRADHVHHVRHRSLGGGDEPENLLSLCAAHHLHGVHRGWVRVAGRAPDGLVWGLGVGDGGAGVGHGGAQAGNHPPPGGRRS